MTTADGDDQLGVDDSQIGGDVKAKMGSALNGVRIETTEVLGKVDVKTTNVAGKLAIKSGSGDDAIDTTGTPSSARRRSMRAAG